MQAESHENEGSVVAWYHNIRMFEITQYSMLLWISCCQLCLWIHMRLFWSLSNHTCMFAHLAPSVPSPIYLSGCITSLLSCWRGERRVLVLLSQPYPIAPTYSIRPHVQSQAQPTASHYLPSLLHTFSVSLPFAHQLLCDLCLLP